MRAAAQELHDRGWPSNKSVDTTGVYVAFDIATDTAYDELANDATVTLFSHPLWDYSTNAEYVPLEAISGDTATPSLPHTFYAVLSSATELPADARVVEYIHIPERQSGVETSFSTTDSLTDYIDELEAAAFEVVGAVNPFKGDDGEVLERAECWTADGRLTVDETLRPTRNGFTNNGPIGLCGAKVILWRGLRSESMYTGCDGGAMQSGRILINCVRRSRHWRVEFKTDGELKVVNAWGIAHDFKRGGDKTRAPWFHNFGWWSTDWMHATLVNGANMYDRFRGSHSMASPWHSFQLLNVRAAYGPTVNDPSSNRHSPWPLTNRLKLWSEHTAGLHKGTDHLQRTLAHELTHSAHYKAGQLHMLNSTDLVAESYADFAEWLFCERFYPHQSTAWDANKQGENFTDMADGYTSVFIDMIDNGDQCTNRGDRPLCISWPNDRVDAYANPVSGGWVIQNAVFGEKHIDDIGNYLLQTFPGNPQNPNLPALIAGFDAIE